MLLTYAKGNAYAVVRDDMTHNGYIEHIKTGITTAWFVCSEGAEELLNLRRLRKALGKNGLDGACSEYFTEGATVYNALCEYGHIHNGHFEKGD